jgi:hypothetical protein
MKILILILSLASITAFSQECECKAKSHKDDFQHATLVLRGHLTEDQTSTKNKPLYQFKIESIYKNRIKDSIDLEYKLTIALNHHESCRPKLEINNSYIFYIGKTDSDVFYLNSCHRFYQISREFINSKAYIELLELASIKEVIKIPKQKTPQIEKFKKNLPAGKFGTMIEKHHP